MALRGVRGAIVVGGNERDDILDASARVVKTMMEANGAAVEDVANILFTATPDLRAAFPAEGARRLGLGAVPLLCAQEIDVPGAMARVIRVLMQFETDLPRNGITHVYLDGAESLRDDLA